MRHRVAGFKLGRDTEHRKAMRRNMAIALFTHGQITTTLPKAKSVQPFVEKLITTARRGDLTARRRVEKAIGNPILVPFDLKDHERKDLRADGYRVNSYHELQDGPRVLQKLFSDIAPRYTDRPGGYTRIIKLAKHRIGDGSDLCVLQLVGDEEGSQVSGRYSRRREKANNREAFAARVRKAAAADTSADASTEAPAEQADTAPVEEATNDATTNDATTQDESKQSPES